MLTYSILKPILVLMFILFSAFASCSSVLLTIQRFCHANNSGNSKQKTGNVAARFFWRSRNFLVHAWFDFAVLQSKEAL